MTGFRRLDEHLVHQGFIWRVVVAEFEAPDGTRFTRDVVRSPGAVGVVAILEPEGREPEVVLLSQWRPTFERMLWEIPAGMRDVAGEPPEETARRELIEEAGFSARRLDHLTSIFPSPGLTDAVTWIYLGRELTAVPQELHGPEEEYSTVYRFPLSEAVAMVQRGEVADAKSVTGILLADKRLSEEQHSR